MWDIYARPDGASVCLLSSVRCICVYMCMWDVVAYRNVPSIYFIRVHTKMLHLLVSFSSLGTEMTLESVSSFWRIRCPFSLSLGLTCWNACYVCHLCLHTQMFFRLSVLFACWSVSFCLIYVLLCSSICFVCPLRSYTGMLLVLSPVFELPNIRFICLLRCTLKYRWVCFLHMHTQMSLLASSVSCVGTLESCHVWPFCLQTGMFSSFVSCICTLIVLFVSFLWLLSDTVVGSISSIVCEMKSSLGIFFALHTKSSFRLCLVI